MRSKVAFIGLVIVMSIAHVQTYAQGAYTTDVYRNLFKEYLNKTDAEITTKLNAAFQQIFYGNSSQQLYYPVGTDMAYILDVANNDVRSEGMSYGLMICVQLDKKAEFDKLWKWVKTYMQHSSGTLDGFFRWQLNTSGSAIDNNPAPDGEAYFITALFFAAHRWGNGTGIYNYEAEAQSTIQKVQSGTGGVDLLFNTSSKLITFGPNGDSYNFTDPSYNLPGFFELWAKWSTSNTSFWAQTPDAARTLLKNASHTTTGLYADYSNFDGTPKSVSYNTNANRFMYDAWRAVMNVGVDYHWFQKDTWQPTGVTKLLTFFKNQGANYVNHYDWNGANPGGDHSTGLVACNAAACLAITDKTLATPFVQELWNVGIPSGTYRYYDGMLYMLGLLNCSGNFKIWKPVAAGPTVTLTAPTVTSYKEPASITITASVTPLANTTISKVEFYQGTTKIGQATNSPYTFTWTNVTAGSYSITAVATDNNNATGTSSAIVVTVTNPFKIYKTNTAITIDGTIDGAWTNASVVSGSAAKLLSGTVTNAADLSGSFKALWDNTYLYLLADVTDDTKVNDSQNSYDDDAVEFYIDINNDKATAYAANDVQYTFGWNDGTVVGSLPSGRSTTNITYSAVAKTGGYIVEARIPWATLTGTPAVGQMLGFDFMINDDDDNGTRDAKLSWNASTDNAWQDPSLFGTAELMDVAVCTAPAAPTVTSPITYCQNAIATALTATGTSLLWYSSSTGGTSTATAPVPSTTAVGTTTYYVSQTVSGCESTTRSAIAVTVNAIPLAPAVTTPVNYTVGATATALTATGTALKWYTVSTGGTSSTSAPIPLTTTVGSTDYYVSQTVNTCESSRSQITVTVNNLPLKLTLKVGWNMVGCPLSGSTPLASAMASIWQYVETVKNMDGFYSTSGNPALNSLNQAEWGKGYFVKVNSVCELDWIAK